MIETAEILEDLYEDLVQDARASRALREQIDEVLAARCACV